MTYVFGWIATVFSLSYKVPQIYTLYKEKKHRGLSITSLVWQAVGYVFYVVHGYLLQDWSIFTMGCVSGVQSVILIILYFAYKETTEVQVSETQPST